MEELTELIRTNVFGKSFDGTNEIHNGAEGHFIETLLGIKHNNNPCADLLNIEIKTEAPKITLFDLRASWYLWETSKAIPNKSEFIKLFGDYNEMKQYYSWSGKVFPTMNKWSHRGTIIRFNESNDLCIYYNYNKDLDDRAFPDDLLLDGSDHLIAQWRYKLLNDHINEKFNRKGLCVIGKDNNNVYNSAKFYKAFSFDDFHKGMITGDIILDSGMTDGKSRLRSNFRIVKKNFIDTLFIKEITP